MNLSDIDILKIITIAQKAGAEIMDIYQKEDFQIEVKSDDSPLTIADKASNQIIVDSLKELYPQLPIISEENKQLSYSDRENWDWCWLVDPLDGTKEFIKRNGEFTVNIALIHLNKIVAGVIYVPAKNKTYYEIKDQGAYLLRDQAKPLPIKLRPLAEDGILKVVGSRSHRSEELDHYVEKLKEKYSQIDFVAVGSSLKFCILAEGKADIYPRFGPTMEWDTGAGHIIAEEAGAVILDLNTNKELLYNKESLLNPFFIVKNPSL